MDPKAKELRQQRAALIAEMHDLTTNSGAWNANADGSKSEAQKRWEEKDAQQKALETQISAIERTAALDEEMRKVTAPPQNQPNAAPENRKVPAAENAMAEVRKKLDTPEYRSAFFEYCRYGETRMARTSRDLLDDVNAEARTYAGLSTSTSGDAAGYTVPIAFQKELETEMKVWGRMRENCRILSTASGNTLDWPTMSDISNTGEWVAEAVAVTQLNPTFSQIQLASYLASSKQVLLSVQLMQDSAFDLPAELKTAFAQRLGRVTNTAYTTGDGSGKPTGLVYSIQHDAVPNVVKATGSSTNDGVSGNTEANSVGSDDLENLIGAVNPAYRPNAKFMMHWQTIDTLKKVKDKYGRPLWLSSITANEPDRIYGYTYDWNADMDAIGANKYPIVFGDFSKYVIRDVLGIQVVRYAELYMPNHQIGFQAFLRTEGKRIQALAFSLLWNPLS